MDTSIVSAFEFIERLNEKNDIGSLTQAFQDLIGQFGFVGFIIGDPSAPKLLREDRIWATTWPEEWQQRYVGKNYLAIDPVIQQLNLQDIPFRWQELRKGQRSLGTQVLEESTEFHLQDGFGVSVRGTNGSVIGISMGTEHYELGMRDEACLHLASIYFQARFEKLRRPQVETPVIKLTGREAEILSWVAAGKSDWEIATILNISQNTAHTHVKNAMLKLGVTTRPQAVAVGLMGGFFRV